MFTRYDLEKNGAIEALKWLQLHVGFRRHFTAEQRRSDISSKPEHTALAAPVHGRLDVRILVLRAGLGQRRLAGIAHVFRPAAALGLDSPPSRP